MEVKKVVKIVMAVMRRDRGGDCDGGEEGSEDSDGGDEVRKVGDGDGGEGEGEGGVGGDEEETEEMM